MLCVELQQTKKIYTLGEPHTQLSSINTRKTSGAPFFKNTCAQEYLLSLSIKDGVWVVESVRSSTPLLVGFKKSKHYQDKHKWKGFCMVPFAEVWTFFSNSN